MFATYLTVTLLTAVLTGLAALANLVGHDYPKLQADKMRVPRSWNRPLGLLLGAGALGLVAGFAVPLLGALAAGGLVLYFAGAFGAHLRARNYEFGAWALFFCLSVASLLTSLAYH